MREDRQSVRGSPAGRWRGWAALGFLAFVLLGAAFAARNAETGMAVALLTGAGLLALGYLGLAVLEPLHRRAIEAVEVEHAALDRVVSLQATCGEGILVLDQAGAVLDWNPAAERIFGYPGHEVRGSNVRMILAELEMRDASPALAREMVGRRRDGVEVQLEIELSASTPDGQRFLIVRDSGRLRTAEALARAAEEERRRVASEALEAILIFDRDGRIQEANPAAERLIGKPWSQLAGRDLADTLLHRDLRAAFRRELRDAAAGPEDRLSGRAQVVELWITGRPAIRAHVGYARAGGRFFAFVLPEGPFGAQDSPLPNRNGVHDAQSNPDSSSSAGLSPDGGLHLNRPR
jgi:PAS domain S-box-containing protein